MSPFTPRTGSVVGSARRWLALLLSLSLMAACGLGGSGSTGPSKVTATPQGPRPNILFILTDDLSWDLVDYMPQVKRMREQGVTFTNFFATNTLCCPSRATILTGRYSHNTQVMTNEPPNGGWQRFHANGAERDTFATSLQAAGYRTGLMGKYLNGYDPAKVQAGALAYVPPGWTEWYATSLGYQEYNYVLSENGRAVRYGNRPEDYLTDVLADKAVDFINRTTTNRPFLLKISTFAPHAPFTPAPRHAKLFPKVKAPRGPAFDEVDVSDKPRWMQAWPRIGAPGIRTIDRKYRGRVRMVQAVDELIAKVRRVLAERGLDRNTYVLFGSDNGFHMGQHRLVEGKGTAYDVDIRVPLIVTGPGVPSGRVVHAFAQNTDLRPTFEELAGVKTPDYVDGRSLVPFLHGRTVQGWRNSVLIEHAGPVSDPSDPDYPGRGWGNPPSYAAVRTPHELYLEYDQGEREYYDLRNDPSALNNLADRLPQERRDQLAALLAALRHCVGAACRTADQGR
ncbi:sulfatase family protein [Actinomadura rubrobrunea]|uniref:sulfatase family protein n=1 Tax=Actinomadura rubrobrunea TaxID=115335 RepID=UPI001C3F194E|nr:sulfatase [Actinomadura rubrobrunea]